MPNSRFERGIVHEIKHIIQGKTQIVEINAHPFEAEIITVGCAIIEFDP